MACVPGACVTARASNHQQQTKVMYAWFATETAAGVLGTIDPVTGKVGRALLHTHIHTRARARASTPTRTPAQSAAPARNSWEMGACNQGVCARACVCACVCAEPQHVSPVKHHACGNGLSNHIIFVVCRRCRQSWSSKTSHPTLISAPAYVQPPMLWFGAVCLARAAGRHARRVVRPVGMCTKRTAVGTQVRAGCWAGSPPRWLHVCLLCCTCCLSAAGRHTARPAVAGTSDPRLRNHMHRRDTSRCAHATRHLHLMTTHSPCHGAGCP